jgi:hypothetical protein
MVPGDFNASFHADVLRVTDPRSGIKSRRGDIFVVLQSEWIQVPSGAAYCAPMGLENFLCGSSTKILILTELGALVAVCKDRSTRAGWRWRNNSGWNSCRRPARERDSGSNSVAVGEYWWTSLGND